MAALTSTTSTRTPADVSNATAYQVSSSQIEHEVESDIEFLPLYTIRVREILNTPISALQPKHTYELVQNKDGTADLVGKEVPAITAQLEQLDMLAQSTLEKLHRMASTEYTETISLSGRALVLQTRTQACLALATSLMSLIDITRVKLTTVHVHNRASPASPPSSLSIDIRRYSGLTAGMQSLLSILTPAEQQDYLGQLCDVGAIRTTDAQTSSTLSQPNSPASFDEDSRPEKDDGKVQIQPTTPMRPIVVPPLDFSKILGPIRPAVPSTIHPSLQPVIVPAKTAAPAFEPRTLQYFTGYRLNDAASVTKKLASLRAGGWDVAIVDVTASSSPLPTTDEALQKLARAKASIVIIAAPKTMEEAQALGIGLDAVLTSSRRLGCFEAIYILVETTLPTVYRMLLDSLPKDPLVKFTPTAR